MKKRCEEEEVQVLPLKAPHALTFVRRRPPHSPHTLPRPARPVTSHTVSPTHRLPSSTQAVKSALPRPAHAHASTSPPHSPWPTHPTPRPRPRPRPRSG